MRPTAGRLSAALLAAALFATACGGSDDTTTEAAPGADGVEAPANTTSGDATSSNDTTEDGDTTTDDGPVANEAALAALDWETVDLDGNAAVGADFAGRDVVLWIWAPWCSVCNKEAPKIRQTLLERQGDVVLLGLPGKDSTDAHKGFVAEHDLGFLQHVVDVDGSIWSSYGVGYQPAFVFINDDGRVAVHPGAMAADQLDATIDELLAT